MTRKRTEFVKPVIVLAILTVVVAVAASAIGGWVQAVGPPVVVIGVGMLWGRVLRGKRRREGPEGE